MPTITVSEETYNKLLRLKGPLDWDSFFELLFYGSVNDVLRYLGTLLEEENVRRIRRWR